MSGFKIYLSNRLEKLSEQLAKIVSEPLSSALSPEIIVVHSKGMERWISLELAANNGICANCKFPFPNNFLHDLFKLTEPSMPDESPFETRIMTFKIMKILLSLKNSQGFEEIKKYLKNDSDEIKLFQLSEKIAETFNQYLVFRPEMIAAWEKGIENHWQARLWQEVSKNCSHLHMVNLRNIFMDKLTSERELINNLPGRISLFGISYLPLFHIEVLEEISHYTEVYLFVLNPCREYWGDIVTERELGKIKSLYRDADISGQELFLEKGNPLLSSLATLGRNFLATISSLEGELFELFEDQDENCILSAIQSDILNLKDRTSYGSIASSSDLKSAYGLKEPDASISINSCHSAMREIEALYDYLLSLFDEDPDLLPKDIMVMTPDIELYAPFINAVFDSQTNEMLKIPFSIADQNVLKKNSIIRSFMMILDLPDKRLTASQVMGLLDFFPIREKFSLKEADISSIERWISDTNIRWGIDDMYRIKIGLPGFKENTWKAGIQRLLLGYAMQSENGRFFKEILPYDNIEGSDAKILGNFLNFLDQLFIVEEELKQKKTLMEWSEVLIAILERFFFADESSRLDRQYLIGTLETLTSNQFISGFEKQVGLKTIKEYFKKHFASESYGGGFIAGGVTFCSMLPLRSIPSKIICLIGLNNDIYPRTFNAPGFDLIARNPRPGDRTIRNDDKYLFLQALISARKKLYISYVGQNNRDNVKIPPSVVVSELLDYIAQGFNIPEEILVIRHRLQSFSEGYFNNKSDKLFSYSKEDFAACKSAMVRNSGKEKIAPFFSKPLRPPSEEAKLIFLGDLCSFLANPSKFLLQKRLGIYLDDEISELIDNEDFTLKGLRRYQIEQDIVNERFAGSDFKDIVLKERALGRLPHGTTGDSYSYEIISDADEFIEKLKPYREGALPKKMDISHCIGEFVIKGVLSNIYKNFLLQIIYVKSKPKYLLRAWIHHLILCMFEKEDIPKTSINVYKDLIYKFIFVENAGEVLEFIVKNYWQGLQTPFAFFPETSFEYFDQIMIKQKSELTALQQSNYKWKGGDFKSGESEDPYFRLCFPADKFKSIVKEGIFQDIAIKIYKPIIDHLTKIEE